MTSGLEFRAQLVLREHRALYDYWRGRAGMRALPAREDLDPSAMRAMLPHLCLVDIEDGFASAVVRLAGTRIRDVYGFELTGKCLADLEWGEKRGYWQAVYQSLLDDHAPLHGAVQGPIARREHVTLLWLRLPLSGDGRTVNKVLCHDVSVPNAFQVDAQQTGTGPVPRQAAG